MSIVKKILAEVYGGYNIVGITKTEIKVGGKSNIHPFADTKEHIIPARTKVGVIIQSGSMGSLYQFYDLKTGEQYGDRWNIDLDKFIEKEKLKEASENVLDKHVKNPKTGHDIKVSSALTYDDSEPVKKKALQMVANADVAVTPSTGEVKSNPAKSGKNARSHKPKSASYGISKECVAFLKEKGFTGLNALPQSFVKPEEIQFNPALKSKDKNSVWVAKFPFMLKNGEKAIKTVYTAGFMKKSQVKKYKKISKIKEKDIVLLEEKTNKLLQAKDKIVADSAAVIGIILKTGLRIGSQDTEDSMTGNMGIRTLHKENITISGDKVSLKFIGKSYQENLGSFQDKNIADYLSSKLATIGDKERVFGCTYGQVNKVMSKINPKGINPKDLRTYKATEFAKKLLSDKKTPPPPLPEDKKSIKKMVKEKLNMVFDKVSKLLNNSPTMARNSYIHPVVITDFLNNLGLTPKFVGYKHVTLKNESVDRSLEEAGTSVVNIILTLNAVGVNRFKVVPTFKNVLHQNQIDSLIVGDNNLTVNNTQWGKLQQLCSSDSRNMSVKKAGLNESEEINSTEEMSGFTTMDEMFEQNMDYGEGVDYSDVSDEDSDECEEYELPEWFYSDEWDLVPINEEELIESVIKEFITEGVYSKLIGKNLYK